MILLLISDMALGSILYSTFRQTSLIYAEKFEFENPSIMEDKQCKQMEQFSAMAKESDYFLSW